MGSFAKVKICIPHCWLTVQPLHHNTNEQTTVQAVGGNAQLPARLRPGQPPGPSPAAPIRQYRVNLAYIYPPH